MRIYLKITNERTRLGRALRNCLQQLKKCHKAWQTLAKKHNAPGFYPGAGLAFKDSVPSGWRLSKRINGCYVPDRRTKEGKRLQRQLEELPGALHGFSIMIKIHRALWPKHKGDGSEGDGPSLSLVNKTGTAGFVEHENVLYLAIDSDWLPRRWLKKLPEGMTEITATQYPDYSKK